MKANLEKSLTKVYFNTTIPRVTQFPIARYSEKLSSDSTNAIFEINPPFACKNPLLTNNLMDSHVGKPYFIEGTSYVLKLNYNKKVFYFALNFLPWEFLLIKKLDFEKTKAT